MRLNNLSARLLMNEWLYAHGYETISGDKSYEEFAIELRLKLARTVVPARFADRAEACRYIRETCLSRHPRPGPDARADA